MIGARKDGEVLSPKNHAALSSIPATFGVRGPSLTDDVLDVHLDVGENTRSLRVVLARPTNTPDLAADEKGTRRALHSKAGIDNEQPTYNCCRVESRIYHTHTPLPRFVCFRYARVLSLDSSSLPCVLHITGLRRLYSH